MSRQKGQNRSKWGETDPRPINRRPAPQLDPASGLPAVGEGLDGFYQGLNRAQRRARAKRQRSKRSSR